jgi:hypothetical protein
MIPTKRGTVECQALGKWGRNTLRKVLSLDFVRCTNATWYDGRLDFHMLLSEFPTALPLTPKRIHFSGGLRRS